MARRRHRAIGVASGRPGRTERSGRPRGRNGTRGTARSDARRPTERDSNLRRGRARGLPGPARGAPTAKASGAPTDDPEPTSRTPHPVPAATCWRPAAEQAVEVDEPRGRKERGGWHLPAEARGERRLPEHGPSRTTAPAKDEPGRRESDGSERWRREREPDAAGVTRERGPRRTEEPREEGRRTRSARPAERQAQR
jgi:hypothetical protein